MADWVTLKNKLGLTLRPIDQWPGKLTYARATSPYSAKINDTLNVLQRELRELRAKNIVLEIAIREKDLRLDGLPRAGALASHPGIILSFESKHGPLRLPFDGFRNWEHNLRAIAMHLEHLRLAGLYGVGHDGEQYRGWAALPAPEKKSPEREAAEWIASRLDGLKVEDVLARKVDVEKILRALYRRLHPDVVGGSHEDFIRLQEYVEILKW